MSNASIPRPLSATAHPEQTRAVVFENPEELALRWLPLPALGPTDLLVEVEWSGISTGTEKLLWTGQMPQFPGMGYPLVPGYETVGRVIASGAGDSALQGQRVFVSGAKCFGEVNGLFGGAASRLVVDASKVTPVSDAIGEEGTLLALAATAHHALMHTDGSPALPDLIVGHGVLGRLLARLVLSLGGSAPRVWEIDAARRTGDFAYDVVDPTDDTTTDYRRIVDVSGDPGILDSLIGRLNRQGEIVLAGFYSRSLSFAFPAAFMREATIRVAAEWQVSDLHAVRDLVATGELSLSGLITHRACSDNAHAAYPLAFSDPCCLKMILDWRDDAGRQYAN